MCKHSGSREDRHREVAPMVPAVDGGRAAAGGRNYSVASITVPVGGDDAVKYDDCQTGKEMM